MTPPRPADPPWPDGGGAFGWTAIARLALVQAALGGLVVLVTSTINRVMVVELALPAVVPALLVALHYAVQLVRPRLGYRSDRSGRRTPSIRLGMALLAAGAVAASAATGLIRTRPDLGVALAVPCFALVGIGAGLAGTSLLALLAGATPPARRAPAAALVWIAMIAGIALTAGVAGLLLVPFSAQRLLAVVAAAGLLALLVACLATAGLEPAAASAPAAAAPGRTSFRSALAACWSDPAARRFTAFVGLSMLAYSAEELLLEPFAGLVFHMPPGRTAQLTALQHGGALAGMLLTALLCARRRAPPGPAAASAPAAGSDTAGAAAVGGCLLSAACLLALAACGLAGLPRAAMAAVFALGLGNGAFAVAAVGAMLQLAHGGAARSGGAGLRLGVWGGAQALAFALGGLSGAAMSEAAHLLLPPAQSYACVFVVQAALFCAASVLAGRIFGTERVATAAPAAWVEG